MGKDTRRPFWDVRSPVVMAGILVPLLLAAAEREAMTCARICDTAEMDRQTRRQTALLRRASQRERKPDTPVRSGRGEGRIVNPSQAVTVCCMRANAAGPVKNTMVPGDNLSTTFKVVRQ